MKDHPFDNLDLLAYASGDVREARRDAISRHLSTCDTCRAFVAAAESQRAAFLALHPFERTITLTAPSQPARRFYFFRRQAYALAATLVLFAAAGYVYLSHVNEPGMRVKGDTSLKIFVKNRQGGVEQRTDNAYYTGEKVQFLYSCGGDNNFALASVDTTGSLAIYFPSSGDSSVMLDKGRDIPLPNSITLDTYAGPEIFVGIFSDHRFSIADLKRIIAGSLGKGGLPDTSRLKETGYTVLSRLFTIKQGTP